MVTATEQVEFFPGVVEAIKRHAHEEVDKGGFECIGFLARPCKPKHGPVTARVPLHNHASEPTQSYFVEPWEQYRAEMGLAKADYVIVGYYHSHPTGEARPSRTDEEMARPGELMVIYSPLFDDLKAWRETEGKLVPVEIVA